MSINDEYDALVRERDHLAALLEDHQEIRLSLESIISSQRITLSSLQNQVYLQELTIARLKKEADK